MKFYFYLKNFLLISLAFFINTVFASNISVEPTTVILTPKNTVQSITVANADVQPLLLQIQSMAWTQMNGLDSYQNTQDLLISPPIVNIPPGEERIIRIGFINQAFPLKAERPYRIFLQQVLTDKETHLINSDKIKVALRIGIPVFIEPQTNPQPQLIWKRTVSKNGEIFLSANNIGTKHVKINAIQIKDANNKTFLLDDFKYILPNSTQYWTLPKDRHIQSPLSLRIEASDQSTEKIILK